MTKQSLITEEYWYAIYNSSLIQEKGWVYDEVKEAFPDMTEDQYNKATKIVMARLLKLSKYEIQPDDSRYT